MDIKDLTPEQLEKVHACATPEDYIDLAKAEGIELTDEQLEAIAGGSWDDGEVCPACGCSSSYYDRMLDVRICNRCGEQF